jgi:hypothetical protein
MFLKTNILALLIVLYFSNSNCQTLNYFNKYSAIAKDSTIIQPKKTDSKKPGGIFLAPSIGLDFPLYDFRTNSNSAMNLGVKLEFTSLSIYPFVLGVFYEFRNHSGNDSYKTLNYINSLETKVTSFGGGVDIILNKFLKSDYTIPFLITEIRYMSMKRTMSSSVSIPLDIKTDDNVIGFTGGFGFTLYIFDLYGTYTYAKDLSSFAFKMRFHFPLLKF